ncbi:MAG TPA: helix-turn-helix domain-containing protein [Solirubrobacteraceae bacterium]|jgi:hypothetical protein|nr:helix-turn-helix domain-containing protein [Solirubrobacteraceae bacterium]
MPEIGAMLREARMRARLDVSEIEAQTKIRAKYLRALENEEWGLLPGPTFVKSFLRTYGEALGLDAKLLVEEYKLRHERLSDVEMQPIMPTPRDQRRPVGASVPRGALALLVLVALIVALGILGLSSRDHANTTSTPTARPTGLRPPAAAPVPATRGTPRRRLARLQLTPTGPVYVCLQAAGGRPLINGAILTPGTPSRVYRGRRLLLTLGNGSVRMRVNGHVLSVPQVSNGVSYSITARGRRPLTGARRPRCA